MRALNNPSPTMKGINSQAGDEQGKDKIEQKIENNGEPEVMSTMVCHHRGYPSLQTLTGAAMDRSTIKAILRLNRCSIAPDIHAIDTFSIPNQLSRGP